MNPAQRTAHLDELNRLDAEIRRANDVYALKPLYDRIEEIARTYPADTGMQSTLATVRASLVARGQRLMEDSKSPTIDPAAATLAMRPPTGPAPAVSPFGATSMGLPASSPSTPPLSTPPATGPATGPAKGFAPPPAKPAAPPATFNWKRAAGVGGVIGLIIAAGGIYTLKKAKDSNQEKNKPVAGIIQVSVKTNPPGASIRVNGEVKCTSDCKLDLPAGPYELQAVLPGYESATSKLDVAAGVPANVDLTLQPLALSVLLYTDFPAGKVTFDGQPYGDLQDGQLRLEKIAPGKHTIKVFTPNNEAQFEFDSQPGRSPVISTPVTAKNTLAILVANAGPLAKVHTSAPNLKVSIDGTPAGETGANGLEIASIQPGDREFVVNDGASDRKLLVSASVQPTLTAYLKLDINAGELLISTGGEDDVSLFVNSREYKIKSKGGQIRLPGIPVGNYTVRLNKEGFTTDPPKTVVIAKNQQAKLEFKFKAVQRFATLRFKGAQTGTQVYLDNNPLGAVPATGNFENTQIPPGEHTVELRRDRYAPKRIPRQFRAGEAVELAASDLNMVLAGATVKLNISPASAQVNIKGPGDAAPRPVTSANLQLGEGAYVFTAKAPNFADKTVSVTLNNGDNRTIEIALTPQQVTQKKDAPPQRRAGGMADWDQPGQWVPDAGWYTQKGGGLVTYGITPTQGLFTFNISRTKGKRLQWVVDAKDAKNYVLIQVDNKNFIRREITNGKGGPELKTPHKLPETETLNVQIEIQPNAVRHFFHDGTNWREIDSWSTSRAVSTGKFGVLIPNNDVYGLSNFRFLPK